MFWVILCTVVAYTVVNLPLLHSLLNVHKRAGLADLWGYAPNQFLFLVMAFPFAAYSTFVSLHVLFTRLNSALPETYAFKGIFDNWMLSLVIGWAVAAVFTSGAYFLNPMSFDKLRPQYARKALESVRAVDAQLGKVKRDDREDYRENLIAEARAAADAARQQLTAQPEGGQDALDGRLAELPPQVYLQVAQSPGLQLRLKLMDPTVHALNVVQLLVALYVGCCALAAAIFCIFVTQESGPTVEAMPEAAKAINAVFSALTFFAFYSIFYQQHRVEMEGYVGRGFPILPDVLTALVIIILQAWLLVSSWNITGVTFIRYVPVIVILVGFVAQYLFPYRMRQLVGSETTWGTQVFLIVLFAILAAIPSIQIWPRN